MPPEVLGEVLTARSQSSAKRPVLVQGRQRHLTDKSTEGKKRDKWRTGATTGSKVLRQQACCFSFA